MIINKGIKMNTEILLTQKEELADAFQKDCHWTVERIILQKPKVTYQDATNVWMFVKLAELEIRLRELENANTVFGNSK